MNDQFRSRFSEKKTLGENVNSLTIVDWIIFFILATICFFTMQQPDILHTGGSSISILNGHFFDFYEYTAQYMGVNNYLISTYMLFALWNIPLYLLKIVTVPTWNVPNYAVMWYKLLPTIFYVLSAYLIYKIVIQVGFDKSKSKMAVYAFVTMPIAFFSQFIFGQYDSFTVFFILLGIYFYLNNTPQSIYVFSIIFGVACTFKYFSFLFFLPLLVLREKDLKKLCQCFILFFIPVLIVVFPYLNSAAFRHGVGGFGATSYVLLMGIDIRSDTRLSIIPIIWIAVCIYFFLKEKIDSIEDVFAWAVFVCNIVSWIIFGLSIWHPQWLLLAVPFWTLGLITCERIDVSCLIDIALMLVFSIWVANGPEDERLFDLGIFAPLIEGRSTATLKLQEIYILSDRNLLWTCFVGMLTASTIMKHPRYQAKNIKENIAKSFGWLKVRFLVGVSIFLLPMGMCLISALKNTSIIMYDQSTPTAGIIDPISDGQRIEQVFVSDANTLSMVDIQIGTYMRINNFRLKVDIIDVEKKEVLASKTVDASHLIDNDYERIDFGSVLLEKGKSYSIAFSSYGSGADNTVSIYRTDDNTSTNDYYAVIDNKKQSFNLAIKIYGKQEEYK